MMSAYSLHTGYDPSLVALSIVIAIFASYTALDLSSAVRGATRHVRWARIAGASLVMGGGIWAMHFVGMLAFEIGTPAEYDFGITLLSLMIAVGVTGFALAWVGRPNARPNDVLIGGPLMGLGIAAMHYTGMAAMRMSASMAYDASIVAVSLALAMTAATAALWVSFRRHGIFQRLVAACVMGFAVAGMHYTGMAAATFSAMDAGAPMAHVATPGPSQLNLALCVAGATFAILFVAMLTSSLEQQRAQVELSNSEARFKAAIQAVSGVLWTNDAEGRMIGEQPGWATITGQSFEEYQGYGWASAVHPDDAAPSLEAWQATVREKRMFVFEHRVRASDGDYRHYAIRAVPILDATDEIREWVGVHTDITAQRDAEAELRESNEELQRYAYIVSHDLRAPLVNVMGFASELGAVQADVFQALKGHPQQAQFDEDLSEALGFIKASVQRMERLIAAILKLSRDGRRVLRPESLDMVALIQGLADAQQHQFEIARATVSIASDLPTITADRLAIEQIFGNLIDNAVKYLDRARAGCINVSAHLVGGGVARFDIEDNGRGIEAKDQDRVFELFRRSGAQDRPGEGIGLAHVKSLVRALGGRITVTSEFGRGTTFSVSLPCTSASRRAHAAGAPVAEAFAS